MNAPSERFTLSLDDKYTAREGWIYLSGTQALVRLAIEQRLRDQAAGLDTGGYITGYRGSPLGRYDIELWKAAAHLKQHDIHFRPAVNEDLAATALWGSQYVGTFPTGRVDGVFGIWYGKGPGVDRCGDVFRHANRAGTSRLGGVLALAGDDHGARSSTIANFSDQIFIATGLPVLYPSNTQELLDYGLHGIAMSRYSGCWVGMKVVADVVEGGGTIRVGSDAPRIVVPEDLPAPSLGRSGVHIRAIDTALVQEARLYDHKLYAALAYIRANGLNRVVLGGSAARIGILGAGKAYQDVRQALMEMGIDDSRAESLGLRIGKVGVLWPLDPDFVRDFTSGLDVVVVVEEKRALLESQLKGILYDLPISKRPRVIGKFDGASEWSPARGEPVFSSAGELSPAMVGRALAEVLREFHPASVLPPLDRFAPRTGEDLGSAIPVPVRSPSFCSGCPHNRSTKVPEGSRALAGIGCHTIAMLQNPLVTTTVSHMGGEGAMWLGQQPFSTEKHVFANMGDGTYFHSGFLAIRQAIAARVPITYKLLANGFVSMTGGQPIDGDLPVPRMVGELAAEGVERIAVVTDDPKRYAGVALPAGATLHPRAALDAVQRELREYPGVSVIVYEQPCATERRRLRKRGKWEDPPKRAFINAAVCDGCGDCGKVSNCLSIEPLDTPLGRKRRINQSSCNKDYTCVEGFCPSFVTVAGGRLRRPTQPDGEGPFPPLPDPVVEMPAGVFNVLVTGVGGTGVVTIGQVLGMAAHLDGLRSSVLDVTGLAQKYGAVLSHVRFAQDANLLHATRIGEGEADTVIGCDLIVTAGDEALSRMRQGRTRVVLGTDLVPTSEFARDPDWQVDAASLHERVRHASGGTLFSVDAIRIATALLGDAIAANMFLLGAAWQQGWIPLSGSALDRAIELNAVSVEFNKRCFLWGRRAAQDLAAVDERAAPATDLPLVPRSDEPLAELVDRFAAFLTDYQDAAYAARYRAMVEKVGRVESAAGLGDRMARAVARNYFKLLAVKDEWEVARLYASDEFRKELDATFEGDYRVNFHLGAWPFARRDELTGKPRKSQLGPWIMKVFVHMAKLRFLRGSRLDPFRNGAERRLANRLLADYEAELNELVARLAPANHPLAVQLASLPDQIRGYGYVREAAADGIAAERSRLLEEIRLAGARAA